MKVVEVTVSAGRTFNHPYESYSNLRPNVTLKAVLEGDEDYAAAVQTLQAKAEALVEDHKQHMLRSLHELERLERYQQEVQSLEHSIRQSQERLDRLRQDTHALTAGPSTETPLEVLKPLDIIDDREEPEERWEEGDRL
jgi:hypothetical protein